MATAGDVSRPFPDWAEPGPALDALYAAFADWPLPAGPFCDRCFDDQSTAAILRPVPVREARPRDFGRIFSEHITCSVGETGFFHFLPRAFETHFFDIDCYPDLTGLAINCGLYRLDDAQQDALADAAAATAVRFFDGRRPEPFCEVVSSGAMRSDYFRGSAGMHLVKLLVAVRVDPAEIFARLIDIGGPVVWHTLARALNEGRFIEEGWRGETGLDLSQTLDTLAFVDFFDIVDESALSRGMAHLDPAGARSRRPASVAANYRKRRDAAMMAPSRRKLAGMLRGAVAKIEELRPPT
ncbi:MAG: hypothetical protein AcusKO_17500 [Acuticoccus sp.]